MTPRWLSDPGATPHVSVDGDMTTDERLVGAVRLGGVDQEGGGDAELHQDDDRYEAVEQVSTPNAHGRSPGQVGSTLA
jgi:hypothetical protein